MAKLNGIEIKSLKSFRGHEGEPLFQGNIYYHGKKLGFWTQDAHGGICDEFLFDRKILEKEVGRFAKSFLVEEKYSSFADLEMLLTSLLTLILDEKDYKKALKKGYSAIVQANDGYHYNYYMTREVDKSKIQNSSYYKNFLQEFEKTAFKNRKIEVKIYTSLDDFILSV